MLTFCGSTHRTRQAAQRHCDRLARGTYHQPGPGDRDRERYEIAQWRVVVALSGHGWTCVGVTP